MKGGVALSQGNQSCLRFSLEESVWFQRGQEVAELVSISLDPNITIQENDQYVSIRGSLELTGEYTCTEQQEENPDHIPALRYVHSVMEREAGVYEFLHRFPVDITIPKNRIESVDDIDISVDSFDYVFPERDRLKLNADLAITGLYGEQQHDTDEEEAVSEAEELEITYREEENQYAEDSRDQEEEKFDFPEIPAFSFVEQNQALKQEEEVVSEEELYAPFRAEARKTVAEEAAVEEPVLQEMRHLQPIQEYSYSQFRSEAPAAAAGAEEVTQPQQQTQTQTEPAAETEVEVEMEQQVPAQNAPAEKEESAEVESSSSPVMKKKKPNMKKGISIAEFLARKADEPEVAKIKVCIVQHGDSLQSISERYEVPVQQLLRVNNLGADHEVREGQVLYVPRAAVHQL
jgi:stage VI sporulation protein D